MTTFKRNFWWQNDQVINHLEAKSLCPKKDENGDFPVSNIKTAARILDELHEADFDDSDYGFDVPVGDLPTNDKGLPMFFAFYDRYSFYLGRIARSKDGRQEFKVTNVDTFETTIERGIRSDLFSKSLPLTKDEFMEEVEHQLDLFTTYARVLATFSHDDA